MRTSYNTKVLQEQVDDGMTISEIAEGMGNSYSSVRMALGRRGISAPKEAEKKIRDKAESMVPIEAVDYLLGVLEDGFTIFSSTTHPIDDIDVHLTPRERQIAVVLYDAEGRVLHKDQLYSAYVFGNTGEDPTEKIVNVTICKIRKKLKDTGLKINTHWGFGYSMTREEDQ